MEINLQRFFDACDPSRTLAVGKSEDRQYYIDFASVRGGKIIDALKRTITRLSPDRPTCQLFTGHIGCGKSTELRRLEAELKDQGFYVVYFESTQDLDMADVDVTDILLAIARQVASNLETVGIRLKPRYFVNLFNEIADFLQTPVDFKWEGEFSLPFGLGKLTAETKDSPQLRSRLRQLLEPRTNGILDAINKELLGVATLELKERGHTGLVVIIDNLDRVDPRPKHSGRLQPEYLFVDRGEQLRKLNCHVVYTIPLALIFSNEAQMLTNRLGGGVAPKVLPMVPVQERSGKTVEEGMRLLHQMVLARAFPEATSAQRLGEIHQIFHEAATLDRLCCVSGGHVRTLMGLLYRCLQEEDPPLSRSCLERVVREHRDALAMAITESEWEMLKRVVQQQTVSGEQGHEILLRSLFVFEYPGEEGRWFGVNPALAETDKYRAW
ncbi:ATP-binding protein [Leptolyngbya sp. FACHB-261]|uniref:ATP-binding protein n=1 Tax=Leptolyngbya sp. FACHB-261 TaxID=2692806 RepID=UPI0016861F3E|nr:ATP-binding protein [Leptolyngbya sp. FACHB-261]MBD2100206.1 ATP-binding protein [Leptolyngbya sp. FACHB-261]